MADQVYFDLFAYRFDREKLHRPSHYQTRAIYQAMQTCRACRSECETGSAGYLRGVCHIKHERRAALAQARGYLFAFGFGENARKNVEAARVQRERARAADALRCTRYKDRRGAKTLLTLRFVHAGFSSNSILEATCSSVPREPRCSGSSGGCSN